MPFALLNYSALSYIVLALSLAVTNVANQKLNFHDFQGPKIKLSRFSMTCTNPDRETMINSTCIFYYTIYGRGGTLGLCLCIYLKRMYEVQRLISTGLQDIHNWIKVSAKSKLLTCTCGKETVNKIFIQK